MYVSVWALACATISNRFEAVHQQKSVALIVEMLKKF